MEAAAPRPPESQGSDPLEEGMALWPTVREQQGEGLHAVLGGLLPPGVVMKVLGSPRWCLQDLLGTCKFSLSKSHRLAAAAPHRVPAGVAGNHLQGCW